MKLLHRLPRWLQFNLRYLGNPPWDTGVSPPELLAIIAEKQPGRALDLGCGTGTNLLTHGGKGLGGHRGGSGFAVRAQSPA